MRKFIAAGALGFAGLVLAASPAAAHLCQNVNKPYGAGSVTPEKIKETGTGEEVLPGAWVDLGVLFGIDECSGQETNLHLFLEHAAVVGGDNGIQLLSADCRTALEEFFGEE